MAHNDSLKVGIRNKPGIAYTMLLWLLLLQIVLMMMMMMMMMI
jgi:hypothetical protein